MTKLVGIMSLVLASFISASPQEPAPEVLYAVTFTTGPGWDTTKATGAQAYLRDHSRNLFRLREEGHLALGGRFGPYGLILVRAGTDSAARALFAADSSVIYGTFNMKVDRWQTLFAGSVTRSPAR